MSTMASLASLTPAQAEAVQHKDGPLLVLAGPGSGKTRVISHRIVHLLSEGVAPSQILALTFTNKAADELRERVNRMVSGQSVWVSTFHRFCARLLREYASVVGMEPSFGIYDTGDSRRALRRAMDELDRDITRHSVDQIAAGISWAKNNLIRADDYEPRSGSTLGHIVKDVYPLYQKRLLSSNAVDFDDLLLHVTTILTENSEIRSELDERLRYILVDEYQDTNHAQYVIVRSLSVEHPNLAVTGDPDQAIYGWRGANLNNILDFESDYPAVSVVRLERNYRSTKRILRMADALISNNRQRKPKRLYTENEEGVPVRYVEYPSETLEARTIAQQISATVRRGVRRPRDFAIFYRVNALTRSLESALRETGVPYQVVNGVEFYQRAEIKDVLAYLWLLVNPRDDVAFERVVNNPARGIGKKSLLQLREAASRAGCSLLEMARNAGDGSVTVRGAGPKFVAFAQMIDRLGLQAHLPVSELLPFVLKETKYADQYFDSEVEEDHQRLANIQELITAVQEFDQQHGDDENSLESFLEQASLVNDIDGWEDDDDRVALMTLHAAKGLEFPVVYIIALENSLIPHERSRDKPSEEEEERRLLFVGITRAQQELQLSRARRRRFRGSLLTTVPSPFLFELPREELDWQIPEMAWEEPDLESTTTLRSGPNAQRTSTPVSAPPTLEALQSKLTTAAELGGGAERTATETDRPSPDEFQVDMVVIHPEYGVGKVVQVSGKGDRRKATVAFATGAGQRSFVLANSKLRFSNA